MKQYDIKLNQPAYQMKVYSKQEIYYGVVYYSYEELKSEMAA